MAAPSTVVPFTDDHLDAAGRLLAARRRAHRLVGPALDPRYEDPDAARGFRPTFYRLCRAISPA